MLAPLAARTARPRRDRAGGGRAGGGQRRDLHVAALVPDRPHRPGAAGVPAGVRPPRPRSTARTAKAGLADASRGGNAGDFVQVRTGNGDVACTSQQSGFDITAVAAAPARPSLAAPTGPPSYFTVSSEDGTSRYRVRASNEPSFRRDLIVATSLADVDATLRRLLLIELLVTVAVVAGLAALGLWVVRLGLRPLDAIGTTAEAIAAGDLTQARRAGGEQDRSRAARAGTEHDARSDRERLHGARTPPNDGSGASSRTRRTS